MYLSPTTSFDPNRSLAFMHIPKAAGISLRFSLSNTLGIVPSPYLCDRVFFGTYSDFDQIAPTERATIFFPGTSDPGDYRFIGGHISLSTFEDNFPNFQLMTLLREPSTRLLSNWVFLRKIEESHLEPWGPEWTRRALLLLGSLCDFMTIPENIPISDNLMTRMLLRPHPLIPIDGPIDPRHDDELTDNALTQLGKFAFVDVVENPGLTENLANWLGRTFSLGFLNITEKIADKNKLSLADELTTEVFDLILQRTRIDAKLWDFVASQRLTDSERCFHRTQSLSGAINRYARLTSAD